MNHYPDSRANQLSSLQVPTAASVFHSTMTNHGRRQRRMTLTSANLATATISQHDAFSIKNCGDLLDQADTASTVREIQLVLCQAFDFFANIKFFRIVRKCMFTDVPLRRSALRALQRELLPTTRR